jgi:hypothetical protein
MEIVSVGPTSGGPEALERELASVAARLDGPRLGILYLPIELDPAPYLAAASNGLGAPIVGATTAGAAFTERGVTRTEPVAAVIGGRDFGFSISVAHDLGRDPAGQVRVAARRLVDGAHRVPARSQVMIALADAFACDGEVLCAALQSSVPPHWRIFGATAGDGWRFESTYVFAGREILRDAAVLIGLFSDARPSLVAHHGWCGAENGREMAITEIDGSILRRLDDRPAADAYRAELVRLGVMRPGDDLLSATATHELGARTMFGDQLKIRAPLRLLDDGAIVLAGSLPLGTMVRVASASPDALIESARTLATRVLEPFENQAIHGALVFDCGARMKLLGDRYAEQVAAFHGGRNFPMIGMAGYGEIAKFAGSIDGFHNATAVMAAW